MMFGWLAKRAARKRAEKVGLEVLGIVRDVVETFGDVQGLRQEIARRVANADFTSQRGLEAIRTIDEREAQWLRRLRG